MKVKIIALLLLITLSFPSIAGIFSSKQGAVFQTKGEALILTNSTFTTGIERRNIPIPEIIDIRTNPDFQNVTHDSESGWTHCRIQLKGQIGITGITERSLVFDCKPLQYFN